MEIIPSQSEYYSKIRFKKYIYENLGKSIKNMNQKHDKSNRIDVIYELTFYTLVCISTPFLLFIQHFITHI